MPNFIKPEEGTYLTANSVAINKNQLLTEKPLMYSGGNDSDGYWIKLNNGVGAFMKTANVTLNSSYNASGATFYRWVFDGSTNTAIRDNFIPKGICFVEEPKCWMFAYDGKTGNSSDPNTSIQVNGIAIDTNDSVNGYVPRTFTLNVNDSTLTTCTITCLMIGSWKTSTTTDSSHKFIEPGNDKKWVPASIAIDNSGRMLSNIVSSGSEFSTVKSYGGNASEGYVKFTDGLTFCWMSITTGTMTATAGSKGYIKSLTPSDTFPCSFLFPPTVFVSSKTYRHIPVSVYDTSIENIGKIVFTGTNETTSTTCHILAVGIDGGSD